MEWGRLAFSDFFDRMGDAVPGPSILSEKGDQQYSTGASLAVSAVRTTVMRREEEEQQQRTETEPTLPAVLS